jgi:succinate dehydrogenase/fumarate reductase flavoprotein subunit
MLDQICGILDWMKAHGVPYNKATEANPSTMVKIYTDGKGAAVAAALDKAARDAGVEILTNTAATELIIENGKVVGLTAESDTQLLTINAKNVILATGGFGMNPEMMAELVPDYADAIATGGAGNTGDGFRMAEAVGAAIYEDPWVIASGLSLSPEIKEAVKDTSALSFKDKVLTDSTGKRFVAEDTGIGSVVTNAAAIREGTVFAIFDSSNADVTPVLGAALASGKVFKGETIEELAAAAGIDAAAIKATIEAYNGYVEAGKDEEFGKDPANLKAYAAGPFYAVVYVPAQLGTIAGVVTDYEGHVLDPDGKIIEGLYAVGEMSNRAYYNQAYVGAASLSIYSAAAKIAAESAVK